jgi:hypothetical protein
MLMPTYIFFITFLYFPHFLDVPWRTGLALAGLVSIITVWIPLMIHILMMRMGLFGSLMMPDRKDRVLPMFATAVIYALGIWFVQDRLRYIPELLILLCSTTLTLLVATVITSVWKISNHSIGVGGAIAFLIGFAIHFPNNELLYPLVGFLIFGGLILWARLYLAAHSTYQLWAGWLLGFSFNFAAVYYFT